ncbi:ATP dependent RNA helicase, partial [Fusarium pseudocircinatum]
MTRPSIVRADTIDLQDHHSPSAQDHSKSPRLGGNANSLGPHQAETIREVTHDIADEQRRSPRVSLDNRNSLDEIDSFADELVANSTSGNTRAQGARDNNSNMNQEDALAIAQNGGVSSSDEGELDGDDDLDDDMMDKISSSPSIEDGGCYPVATPAAWPRRVSSLPSQRSSTPSISGSSGTRVFSPYPEPPKCVPSPCAIAQLPRALLTKVRNHRLHGLSIGGKGTVADNREQDIFYDCDPMLDLSDSDFDDDESPDFDPALTVPYEESFEDDDSALSIPDDYNFIDSGWAVECLQDIEDIDFEFVYALHTFVATVEGQANATKGDTMVLLDDSNSYWWLVRVVKDSSI